VIYRFRWRWCGSVTNRRDASGWELVKLEIGIGIGDTKWSIWLYNSGVIISIREEETDLRLYSIIVERFHLVGKNIRSRLQV
jgi:hypothetical protein